jgi:glutathione synthase/RimK-type ligase-like ATP-grasp enzyme
LKKIIFLTNYQNIIPQRNNEIEGLNLDLISRVLEVNNFNVEKISLNAFIGALKEQESIEGVYFYYTSSQYPIYKSFILDVLKQIELRGGILIPELRHFISHENKNFQELEKTRLGIKSPYGLPIGTYEEGLERLNKVSYPIVIKKSCGFRSRNVKLANNVQEGKKMLLKMLEGNVKFSNDGLYYLYRKFKNKKHYPKKFGKIIIQEFIPDLTYDWKILVFGERCIGGKRYVKKNDFRASGSKLYSLEQDPPDSVLNFALRCKKDLNCSNISLDISENKGDVQLLEYQTMHFSLLAWKSVHYFEKEKGNWKKFAITEELEHYMGIGIYEHIKSLEKKELK